MLGIRVYGLGMFGRFDSVLKPGVSGKSEECMVGCQNYGPFLGPYYNTAPNI